MQKHVIVIPILALCALLAGCEGTGPNTQRGAVTGGVLGAAAGAIIGNNTHGGNSVGGALIGGALGALAGGTIGNSQDHEENTVYGQPTRVVQRVEPPPAPPPAPAEAVSPSPGANAVWIPGYWLYNGGYVWQPGHWEIPPPYAHSYVAAHWEFQNDRYVFVHSYWR